MQNFNEKEKEILKFWKENKIFQKSLEKTKNGKDFVCHADAASFCVEVPLVGTTDIACIDHYGHFGVITATHCASDAIRCK